MRRHRCLWENNIPYFKPLASFTGLLVFSPLSYLQACPLIVRDAFDLPIIVDCTVIISEMFKHCGGVRKGFHAPWTVRHIVGSLEMLPTFVSSYYRAEQVTYLRRWILGNPGPVQVR
jgi:hypothetical protein